MIIKGIDCGSPLNTVKAAQFKKDGVSFIGRYVTPESWKTLSKAEADILQAAGLQILSVFERSANRTKGGHNAGAEDGREAYTQARNIGQPVGSAIYFAVDYDAPESDFELLETYLRAAVAQIPGYKLGVYGSYSVIEAMSKRFPGIYGWQTIAWSRGKRSESAHVFQREINVTQNGHLIDWNEQMREAGLWPIHEEGVARMTKEDANKITAMLGTVYNTAKVCGAGAPALAEIGRLADEVRAAAGLPKQNL
ncbi:DUF1906 domain-containing protein [Gorillibacterium massiliense]|uniref:DUF1906 domain-containing protein n=1 Tax=Gorillibacterium massiliense TaxID=1280390 RepID=UPI0004B0C227|nr:DUF1906 domain-containing protein [Gorillibacterium massiliense]